MNEMIKTTSYFPSFKPSNVFTNGSCPLFIYLFLNFVGHRISPWRFRYQHETKRLIRGSGRIASTGEEGRVFFL